MNNDLDSDIFSEDSKKEILSGDIKTVNSEVTGQEVDARYKDQEKSIDNKSGCNILDSNEVPKVNPNMSHLPMEYLSVIERVRLQYGVLPKINYNVVYNELKELNVNSVRVPTLQSINEELQRIQAAKDRLSEIFLDVNRAFFFKKRAVDILKNAWMKYSSEKSSDKRSGEADEILINFMNDFSELEGLFKSCVGIMKNLDSSHERLYKTITIEQLTMKLSNIGRSGLPDLDNDTSSLNNTEYTTDGKGGTMYSDGF